MRLPLVVLTLTSVILNVPADAARPVALHGDYLEARTCDVWVGACFANAEMNLTGKHATLAWRFTEGKVDGCSLAGLSVVAIVEANDTLGLDQKGPAKAMLFVDEKANHQQQATLVKLAKKLGGQFTARVIEVKIAPIAWQTACCKDEGCAKLTIGSVGQIETRCIHEDEDKVCGHEDNFYPPLTAGVTAKSAMITTHRYAGPGFNKSWDDASRRGAYVGTFAVTE